MSFSFCLFLEKSKSETVISVTYETEFVYSVASIVFYLA